MSDVPWSPPSLVDALTDAVIVADRTNRVVYGNPAAAALLGRPIDELVGQPLPMLVPERLRQAHVEAFSRVVATGEARLVGVPLRVPALRGDGSEVDIELVISSMDGTDGHPLFVGVLRAAGERLQVGGQAAVLEQLLRVLSETRTFAEAAPRVVEAIGEGLGFAAAGLWVVDVEHAHLACDAMWTSGGAEAFADASRDLLFPRGVGLPGRVWEQGEPTWVVDVVGDANFPRVDAAAEAGLHGAIAFPLASRSRVLGVVELFSRDPLAPDVGLVDTLAALGLELGEFLDARLAEEERGELLAREQQARADAEAARTRLEFVLAASTHLVSSLEQGEILHRLGQLAVPLLGDMCVVDLVDDDGVSLRRELVTHADAEMQPFVDQAFVGRRIALDSDHPVARVLRTGEPELAPVLSDERLLAGLGDETLVAAAKELGMSSLVTVPLVSRGRTLGALSLVSSGAVRRYDKDDLDLALALAGPAGLALENARVYARERGVAETLQRAFLPRTLPDVPGYQVAARYYPSPGGEVGGDWYDLIPLAAGGIGVVIGDVGGQGLRAAAVMGQLRNALRAFALDDPTPAEVCNRLERLVEELEPDAYATLFYGLLDPASGRFTCTNAGHPPPLLVPATGEAGFFGGALGAPLGALGFAHCEQVVLEMQPGDLLFFYTDGLVERRGVALDDGMAELEAAVLEGPTDDVDQLCVRVIDASADTGDDDVAVLVIRRDP